MKKTLLKLKDGVVFGIGFLLIIGIANAAWVNLSTVDSGQPLTKTLWDEMIGKINENGNKLDGITNVGGNIGIGTGSPNNNLEIGEAGTHEGYAIATNTNQYGAIIQTSADVTSGAALWVRTNTSSTPKNLIYAKNNGNVGIGTTDPKTELTVNGTIETNAFGYADKSSFMPNDMSYSAGGYVLGSKVVLDKGVYLIKNYTCGNQNSFNGGSHVNTYVYSGEVDTTYSYFTVNANSGACGFFDTSILRVKTDNAEVAMKVGDREGAYNIDQFPATNSTQQHYFKIY